MKVNKKNIGYVRHSFTPVKNKLLNKNSKTESKFEQMLIDANIYFTREKGNYKIGIRLVQDGAITISSFRIGECTSNSMDHHTTRKSKRLSILKKTASYARSSALSVESVMITSWTR